MSNQKRASEVVSTQHVCMMMGIVQWRRKKSEDTEGWESYVDDGYEEVKGDGFRAQVKGLIYIRS